MIYPDRKIVSDIIDAKKYIRRVRTDFKSPYFFYNTFGTDNDNLIKDYTEMEENRQFYGAFCQGLGFLTAISGVMTLLFAILTGGIPEKVLSLVFACAAVLTVVLVLIYNCKKNQVNAYLFKIEKELINDYKRIVEGSNGRANA